MKDKNGARESGITLFFSPLGTQLETLYSTTTRRPRGWWDMPVRENALSISHEPASSFFLYEVG